MLDFHARISYLLAPLVDPHSIFVIFLVFYCSSFFLINSSLKFPFPVFSPLYVSCTTFNLISILLLRISPQKIAVAWMSLPCIVMWNQLPVSHNSLLLYIFVAITTNAYTLECCYIILFVDMCTKKKLSTACMYIYWRAHFSCEMTKQKMVSSTTYQKMPYIV